MQLLSKSERIESSEEHRRMKLTIGVVLYELGEYLLYPIFCRHKNLIPEEMKAALRRDSFLITALSQACAVCSPRNAGGAVFPVATSYPSNTAPANALVLLPDLQSRI